MAWTAEDQYEEDRYEALRDRAEEQADLEEFPFGFTPNDFATEEEYDEALEQAYAEQAANEERRYFAGPR